MSNAMSERAKQTRLLRLRAGPGCLRLHVFENYGKDKLQELDTPKTLSKYKVVLKPVVITINTLFRACNLEDVSRLEVKCFVDSVFFKTRPDINDWDNEPFIEVTKRQISQVFTYIKDHSDNFSKAESAFFGDDIDGFGDIV